MLIHTTNYLLFVFFSISLFSLERKKGQKSSRTAVCSPFPLVTIEKFTGLFFIPIQPALPPLPFFFSATLWLSEQPLAVPSQFSSTRHRFLTKIVS